MVELFLKAGSSQTSISVYLRSHRQFAGTVDVAFPDNAGIIERHERRLSFTLVDLCTDFPVGNNWFVSAFFGASLIIAGVLMLRSHYYAWVTQRHDSEIDERELRHLQRRFRRRLQASGILVLIGIMIPIGDMETLFKDREALFAMYWFTVLALTMWLGLLALGDLVSTRVHSQVSISRLEQKQRALEQEVATLQSRQTNGRHSR